MSGKRILRNKKGNKKACCKMCFLYRRQAHENLYGTGFQRKCAENAVRNVIFLIKALNQKLVLGPKTEKVH